MGRGLGRGEGGKLQLQRKSWKINSFLLKLLPSCTPTQQGKSHNQQCYKIMEVKSQSGGGQIRYT